jgi:hypothetical protein
MKIVTRGRRPAFMALVVAGLASCAPAGTTPPAAAYPDPVVVEPLYLPAAGTPGPIGRSVAERRRLAGRGEAFMRGIVHVPGTLPVRRSTWWSDAAPLAAGGYSVAFATPWVPASRLDGSVTCPPGAQGVRDGSGLRLLAVARDSSGDLLLETWLENASGEGCEGNRGARDRVRAFADDVEMFARNVSRLGVPVPVR